MASLIDEQKDLNAKQISQKLFLNISQLKTQYTEAQAAKTATETKIKSAVSANNFDMGDFAKLLRANEMIAQITAKYSSIKTQLASIKADLLSSTHKTELQAEIDKIP